MKKYLFLLLISLVGPYFAHSQAITPDSLPTPATIDGKQYYLHPIVKGNTLYSISKQYGIAINDLKLANQEIWNSMRIGDTLKVPLQAIELLKEDQEQSDGNFIIHDVRRKNTLYSIAQEYNLEISEILVANPGVEDTGLKKGMKLKIPVAKIKSEPSSSEYVVPHSASPYLTHRVLPKETLYSLSKIYSVSIDSIKSVNNGLPEGLKVNQLINLPILKAYKDTIGDTMPFDSSAIKSEYTVSLLLPFYLDEIEKAKDTSGRVRERIYQKLYARSQYAIDFYNGFSIAADSLSRYDLKLNLKVFDTANDTAKLREMIEDSLFVTSDLIIGPLYYDEFVLMSDYAKRNQIHIVSPVKQSNKVLLGNEHVSKVVSSDPILLRFLGAYLADSLADQNLLMVYPDHYKDRNQAELLRKSFLKTIERAEDSLPARLKEMMWNPKESNFRSKLDSSKMNVIVAPSTDQAFVTQLMTKLRLLDDFSFTLIGMEDWLNFDNLDVAYLHRLNVHIVSTELIDFESKAIKNFSKTYRKAYELPADQFSVLGFDVGMFYLNFLKHHGLNFNARLKEEQSEYLSRKFNFFKTGIESGYENHSVYLLRYDNYKVVKVH